jgi:hypothetical protein
MRCLAHGNRELGMCECGVSGGKTSGDAARQRKDELNMQKQAFQTQMDMLAQQRQAFSKYQQGNVGFDPMQLALMRSQALSGNAGAFNSAGQQVRSALAARGSGAGNLPVGGDYTRGIAGLMGAKAQDISGQLANINLQNAQQALANKFNAGNLLSGGMASTVGTQGVAGQGASSALNTQLQAANSGFLHTFTNAFGQALGSGLGGGITGGLGTAASHVGSGNYGW